MATIQEIATVSGVSKMTVSKILRGKGTFLPTTRQRVLASADKLGYRPNAAARAMTSGRFGAFAFIQRENADFMPYKLLRAVERRCRDHDLNLVFSRMTRQQIGDESRMPRVLSEASVDGLLIHEAGTVPPEAMDLIERHRIPTIWINERREHNCVYPDDRDAAERITRRLIEWGHRRITHCAFALQFRPEGEVTAHYSQIDRRGGYEAVMRDAGLMPQTIKRTYRPAPNRDEDTGAWDTIDDDRIELACAALRADDRPTAVVGLDPDSAGPWIAAALRLGLRVPEDLSVVTTAVEQEPSFGITLAMLEIPMVEVGWAAVDMLRRRIRLNDRELPSQAVRYTIEHGRSWGPAPDASPGSS